MDEKEVKQIFNELTEENKEVLNLLAKGMQIAQENGNKQYKANMFNEPL